MRKNNLFLLLLMALIVMSCSKDETTMSIPQESNAIEFGTYVGRDAQTRASVIDADALKDTGFGVFAYYTDGGDYKTTSTPNFMWNTKVSTASWTYSPIKYWPNESTDKLTFFAYAPYSDGSQNNISDFTGNTATGDPTLKFTVNSAVKNQTDLLYADASDLKNLTKQSVTGKVIFPFKHALSRIGFKVEVSEDFVSPDGTGDADSNDTGSNAIEDGTVVSVQKVELIGKFTTSATFSFATNSWTSLATDAGTEPIYPLVYVTDETSNFEASVAEGVTISPQVLNKDDSYIMIIPKTFDASDQLKIRVTYKVTTTDTALKGDKSEITNIITSDPFAFPFEAGKAYSFNLHLGLTSVKFDADVSDWDIVTPGTVVNAPINIMPVPESNSYIVAPGSAGIRIPVSRANASDLLTQPQLSDGDAFTAELVWTDNQYGVAANSNIKSIAVEGTGPTGYLVVEPGSAEGNAVVAIKKGGKILWSWHIWVTNYAPNVGTTTGDFMDRNLGAMNNYLNTPMTTDDFIKSRGLLYQWGRKDPFPGSNLQHSNRDPVLYNAGTVNPVVISKYMRIWNDYANNPTDAFANPLTFYFDDKDSKDWYSLIEQNNNLWKKIDGSKSVYDPCPPGWSVPKKESLKILETKPYTVLKVNYSTGGRSYINYGGFYPLTGYRVNGYHSPNAGTTNENTFAGVWTSDVEGTNASAFHFDAGDTTQSEVKAYTRGTGLSVRCVKE